MVSVLALSVTFGATLPLLSLRDIFPRSGGSRPSRERFIAVTVKFPAELKGSPLGELSRSD